MIIIQVWISKFQASGSAMKRKPTGQPRTVKSLPENVAW